MRRTRSCPTSVHLENAAALIPPPWTPRAATRITEDIAAAPMQCRETSNTSSASASSASTRGSRVAAAAHYAARSSSNTLSYSAEPPARPTCPRPSLAGFFNISLVGARSHVDRPISSQPADAVALIDSLVEEYQGVPEIKYFVDISVTGIDRGGK